MTSKEQKKIIIKQYNEFGELLHEQQVSNIPKFSISLHYPIYIKSCLIFFKFLINDILTIFFISCFPIFIFVLVLFIDKSGGFNFASQKFLEFLAFILPKILSIWLIYYGLVSIIFGQGYYTPTFSNIFNKQFNLHIISTLNNEWVGNMPLLKSNKITVYNNHNAVEVINLYE